MIFNFEAFRLTSQGCWDYCFPLCYMAGLRVLYFALIYKKKYFKMSWRLWQPWRLNMYEHTKSDNGLQHCFYYGSYRIILSDCFNSYTWFCSKPRYVLPHTVLPSSSCVAMRFRSIVTSRTTKRLFVCKVFVVALWDFLYWCVYSKAFKKHFRWRH